MFHVDFVKDYTDNPDRSVDHLIRRVSCHTAVETYYYNNLLYETRAFEKKKKYNIIIKKVNGYSRSMYGLRVESWIFFFFSFMYYRVQYFVNVQHDNNFV